MKFAQFCNDYRCYRQINQYFDCLCRPVFCKLLKLYELGKLPYSNTFAVNMRRLEFLTRQLRRAFDTGKSLILCNAVCNTCAPCLMEG